jgi:nitrate reductase NapE component
MKELIALGLTCFLVGFVTAYGFDAWLQWRDDRKWR